MASWQPSHSLLDRQGLELLRERYYTGVDTVALFGVVLTLATVAAMWGQASRGGLLVWAVIMFASLPIAPLVARWAPPLERWFHVLVPVECVLGIAWGLIALLAMPSSEPWQAILGAMLAGVILAATITSAQVTVAHLSFTGSLTATAIVGFALHADGAGRFVIVLLLIAWGFAIALGVGQRQVQLELVRALRHNADLVDSLEQEHEQLVIANRGLAAAAARADRMARTDHLTQLANRHHFDQALAERLAALHAPAADGDRNDGVALGFVDLDRFKQVNDALGHRMGDQLLVAVAERLEDNTGPGELLARIGGDEFVMIASALDPHDLARRMAAAFERPFRIDGREIVATASIGIATTHDADDAVGLLRRADAAQYEAKRAGGGAAHVHWPTRPTTELADDRDDRLNDRSAEPGRDGVGLGRTPATG